jgi:hypothetical protein
MSDPLPSGDQKRFIPLDDPKRVRELCEAALRDHLVVESAFSPVTFQFLGEALAVLPGLLDEVVVSRKLIASQREALEAGRVLVDTQREAMRVSMEEVKALEDHVSLLQAMAGVRN